MKRALGLYIPFLSTDRLQSLRNAVREPGDSHARDTLGHGTRRFESPTAEAVGHPAHARDTLGHGTRAPGPSRTVSQGDPSVVRENDAPVATVTPHANTLRIVHVNQAARDRRIRPGQTLADAKAVLPDLAVYPDDPAADRRQLEALAVWGDRFSPLVHIEGDDTLILDVTGCERLFHGEENLLRQAMEGLNAQGFTARGAMADAPGAAWALAHAHGEPFVISPPGQTAAALASLPVWSLRVDDQTTAALDRVGVETVASLLHLPRSSLASRFGEALLDRIDQALGDRPEVLTPYRPPAVLTSRVSFGAPRDRIEVLREGVQRALEVFCEKLARQAAGVCQVFVTFYCSHMAIESDRGTRTVTRTVTLPISLSRPTRSVKHLGLLSAVLLDRLRLPAPADAVALWARRLDPLDDWQDELFPTGSSDGRELEDLVDRLSVRLGSQAVVRPQLLSDHQPERAFRYVPLADFHARTTSVAVPPTSVLPGPRPLRLMSRPVEVGVTAVVPEGPPIAFQLRGTRYTVEQSVGPERIETGWWRGSPVRRDYYRVTTDDGRRAWLFRARDTGRWFLHGWFD